LNIYFKPSSSCLQLSNNGLARCWFIFGLFWLCAISPAIASENEKVSTIIYAKILNQGLIEPFENPLINFGRQKNFEPSAVYLVNNNVFLINDRPLPEEFPSPLIGFSKEHLNLEIIKKDSIFSVTSAVINSAMKIEAATQSFDKQLTFASASFSYFIENEPEKDAYNSILYWSSDEPGNARIFNPSVRSGVKSSLSLRKKIKDTLKSTLFPNGPNYFKVEGLAYLPENKLAFGIRSLGADYDSSTYQFIIITADINSTPLKTERALTLSNFELLYRQDNKHFKKHQKYIQHEIGISSIEYDFKRNGFFILTSFEDDDDNMGAYLWFYPDNKVPQLVFSKKQQPLIFKHKAEAFILLDEQTLLVIHDDDREELMVDTGRSLIKRDTNQGVFSIVRLEN